MPAPYHFYLRDPDGTTIDVMDYLSNKTVNEYGAVGDGVTDDTAALQLAADTGYLNLIPGVFKTTAPILRGDGLVINGTGIENCTIYSAHAGATFANATPGTRVYNWSIMNVQFLGPGKTTVGSCGVDMSSVSSGTMFNCVFTQYEKAIRVRGANGFSTYNRFLIVKCQNNGTGWSVEGEGCNATELMMCRANSNDIGILFYKSNECSVTLTQIETNGIGLLIDTDTASTSDGCVSDTCRFESNTLAWQTTALVKYFTLRTPRAYGSPTYVFTDSGANTTITNSFAPTVATSHQKTLGTLTTGQFIFERTGNGGTDAPCVRVYDSGSTGTPVTLLAETSRTNGWFFRAAKSTTSYFDINSLDGSVRLPQGGYVELYERTAPAAPAADQARLYIKDNGSGKTQLCVLFATGVEQVVATQP